MWHYGDWGGAWMLLWMALFWGAVILLIVWGVGRIAPSPRTRHRAREILEERYARGEIDADELQERLATLDRT